MTTNENFDAIYLPVSLGEAIDKLTILDIKLDNIKDERRTDVEIEYNLLYEKLKNFIEKYKDLYNSMKKVNKLIWDMMDKLRDADDLLDDIYLKICKDCIEYNDIRFRIKNKINYVSKSSLKEQKSYKINRLLIEIVDIEQDLQHFIIPIKYYSFFYDEIIIVYNGDTNIIKKYFDYDPTIKIYSINTILTPPLLGMDSNLHWYKKTIKISNQLITENDIYNIFELSQTQINQIL